MAGLWIIAIVSLVAIVGGTSSREGRRSRELSALCFTLATGFLAVSEAVSNRKTP